MKECIRYRSVLVCAWLCLLGVRPASGIDEHIPPNIVILFCDDLGYGDLGCYGHPTIRTPHIDQLAADGIRFTQFYTAAAVCSPARASLLTGRYPPRHGTINIYAHDLDSGMDLKELTLAQLLAKQGYASACIGKWHLGHDPQYLPQNRGFDSYYGVPYSNDMQIDPKMTFSREAVLREGWTLDKVRELSFSGPIKPTRELVPLMQNDKVVEYPTDQSLLTRRYTERACAFIQANQARPFFLYLAYTMPHVPLTASEAFAGKSPRGTYGDAVEEIDWSVGAILSALQEHGLEKNTVVFFTSDNGPWLSYKWNGGSPGLLRGGKFTTWEGGMRVPAIARWPGKIEPAVTADLASTLDLFTTCLHLAAGETPSDRVIDGVDLSDLLLGHGKSPRQDFAYYRQGELQAYRLGKWKVHFRVQPEAGGQPGEWLKTPLLFQLESDPGEQYDVGAEHPEVIQEMVTRAATFRSL